MLIDGAIGCVVFDDDDDDDDDVLLVPSASGGFCSLQPRFSAMKSEKTRQHIPQIAKRFEGLRLRAGRAGKQGRCRRQVQAL